MEHQIEDIEQNLYAPRGQGLWQAVCSCRNPDGDGVGEVAFSGATIEEVVNSWGDHLAEEVSLDARNDALVDAVTWAECMSGESADSAAEYIKEMATLPTEKENK